MLRNWVDWGALPGVSALQPMVEVMAKDVEREADAVKVCLKEGRGPFGGGRGLLAAYGGGDGEGRGEGGGRRQGVWG